MFSHTRSRSLVVLILAMAFATASLLYAAVSSRSSLAAPDERLSILRLKVQADAFVASNAPTSSFGDLARVVARKTPEVRKRSYLKFQVPRAALDGGAVVSARLVLTPRSRVPSPVAIGVVKDNEWTEDSLSFASAPAVSRTVGVVEPGGLSRRVVDVSGVVDGPGTFSFSLSTDSGLARFWSGQSDEGPRLLVTVRAADNTTGGTTTRRCSGQIPGAPCPGKMYYGAHVEGGDAGRLESKVGMKLSIHRWYMTVSNKASAFASRASTDVAANRIPLLSTKAPGSWAQVAAGKYDGWLTDRIRALASVKGPVWFTLHHEPRGDGDPADWVRMQQHTRNLIDKYSDNIALVGILNGWDFLRSGGNPAVYRHPVGTGVHIMGFDSYNQWSRTNGNEWWSVSKVMSPGLKIQSWGYPTLVGETGVRADPSHPGRAAQWLRDQYTFGVNHGFLAIAYYHSKYASPDGTWELDGERLSAFRQNLAASSTARVKD